MTPAPALLPRGTLVRVIDGHDPTVYHLHRVYAGPRGLCVDAWSIEWGFHTAPADRVYRLCGACTTRADEGRRIPLECATCVRMPVVGNGDVVGEGVVT